MLKRMAEKLASWRLRCPGFESTRLRKQRKGVGGEAVGQQQQDRAYAARRENNGGDECRNTLACAAWFRREDFAGAGDGVRRENGGRSWVVNELRIVDQGENLGMEKRVCWRIG